MNKIVLHSILFLSLCVYGTAGAQEKKHLGYSIEGDEVVFSFDVRDYEKATKDHSGEQLDFSDLDIYNVAVSGTFNNWSRDQWKMKKTGPYTYELRKKLSALDNAVSWEFKFIVNGSYWAEPRDSIANVVRAKKDSFWLSVYNLELYTAAPAKNGNVRFYLDGHTNARKVILTGTFNRWDEHAFEMKKTEKGWELRLQLSPGDYEYKFIVDGNWMHDPANPEKRRNRFHTWNSLISVTKTVDFTLKGYLNAKTVILSGSFNNWDTRSIKMTKTSNGWCTTLNLRGGKIHYKYIVDGNWITDPQNPVKEYDGHGNINSVRIIE